MCLITFSYKQHQQYPFILVANRDEFYQRESAAMTLWPTDNSILAGQDLTQMGSWLGLHKSGRFSAVTNFRQKAATTMAKPLSRGHLVSKSLASDQSMHSYLTQLAGTKQHYGAYNFLCADNNGLYFSNNHSPSQKLDCAKNTLDNQAVANDFIKLSAGLFGLCNATLDTPWPKLTNAKRDLEQLINNGDITLDTLKQLLNSSDTAPEHKLPNTGIDKSWERALSAQFINLDSYGTRAKTIILQRQDGFTQICEARYDSNGFTGESVFELQIPIIGER
jgi:uncharacterized protein with NRDE domain